MGTFVTVAAIDAVLGGNEIQLDDTPVEIRDSSTGYDGPGAYHIQLNASNPLRKYRVTYGLAPADSASLLTVGRVVVTPSGQLLFKDARQVNVGMTGVNATILQVPIDGSYLADNVVVPRNIKGGVTALLDTLGTAQGDILYRSATDWVVLTPGTAGDVLTTGGASANPSWAPASGGGPVTVPHGSSFPGTPSSYELFYRDDLLSLFIWNGSSWENSDSLAQLNDITLTSPANGDVLTYDATATKWKNAPVPSSAPPTTGSCTESTQAATITATKILSSSSGRLGVIINNRSAATLYLGSSGSTSSALFFAIVQPNGEYVLPIPYTGDLWAIWDSAPGGQANIAAFPS